MEFRVLGPLEAREGDRSLPLGGTKQRALAALLVLDANRVVSRERLIDELWGEEPPGTAVATVQESLRHARIDVRCRHECVQPRPLVGACGTRVPPPPGASTVPGAHRPPWRWMPRGSRVPAKRRTFVPPSVLSGDEREKRQRVGKAGRVEFACGYLGMEEPAALKRSLEACACVPPRGHTGEPLGRRLPKSLQPSCFSPGRRRQGGNQSAAGRGRCFRFGITPRT